MPMPEAQDLIRFAFVLMMILGVILGPALLLLLPAIPIALIVRAAPHLRAPQTAGRTRAALLICVVVDAFWVIAWLTAASWLAMGHSLRDLFGLPALLSVSCYSVAAAGLASSVAWCLWKREPVQARSRATRAARFVSVASFWGSLAILPSVLGTALAYGPWI
jgi:hypothetical protein